jgi:hypothetical protein
MPCEENNYLSEHIALLRSSLLRLTGKDLIEAGSDIEAARSIFSAPFMLVSHNTDAEPIFNYANQTALRLFEMDWEEFVATPSKNSAAAVEREERSRFLAIVTAKGFIDNYSGIRISRTQQRFMLQETIVWNLADEAGNYRGQAALCYNWKFL